MRVVVIGGGIGGCGMVGEGFWRWMRPGGCRGIPFSNFVGWFAAAMETVGLAIPPRVLLETR